MKKNLRQFLQFIFRFVLYTFLSVVILLAGGFIFLETPIGKSVLKTQVVGIVNDELNATLSLEEIDGNFFTSLILKKGRLAFGDTSIVEFESLSLNYNALTLIDNEVLIKEVRLIRPKIFMSADSSGVLNFSRIAKPSAPKPPKPIDSTAKPLGGMNIVLDQLAIEDGDVEIDMGAFKTRVTQLQLDVKAQANGAHQNLSISRFSFNAIHPKTISGKTLFDTLRVKNFSLLAQANIFQPSLAEQARFPERRDSLTLKIDEMRLVTDRTDFFVRGELVLPDSLKDIHLMYDVDVRAYPFHLSDARVFADVGMNDIDKIELETHARGDDEGVLLTNLRLTTPAGNLNGYAGVDYGEGPLGYKTDLVFNGINLGAFLNQKDLFANLNGRVTADGIGTDPNTLLSNVQFSLFKSRFFAIDIDSFNVDANVKEGEAKLTRFKGRTSAGDFDCEGYYKLLTEEYHLETKFRHINIADLVGDTALQSSINLNLAYDGKGLNPKTSNGQLSVHSESSMIMNRRLENLVVRGSQSNGQIHLDNLKVVTPLASIEANGALGLDSTVNMNYKIKTLDFSLLKKYIGSDSLFKDTLGLDLAFEGNVIGNYDNLQTSGAMTLTNFIFSTIKLDSLSFNYAFYNIVPREIIANPDFKRIDNTVYGDIFLFTRRADINGTVINDFTTSITKERDRTSFEISGLQDTLDAYANIKGSLFMHSEKKGDLQLENLYLRISGKNLKTRERSIALGEDPVIDTTYEKWTEKWQNNKPIDLTFDLDKNVYDIRSFSMDIGDGFISLFGNIDIAGDQNLDVKIKDLNLSRANALIGSNQSVVEGLLNLNASIKGSFEKPIMILDWNITNGKASEFVYNNFLGNMQYLNRKVQFNMSLNQNADKTLTVGGYLPVDLSFKDVEQRFTTRPINCKIHSEGIDLRFLQAFFGKALTLNRGDLKIDMKISGNKEKPVVEGEMKIEDGVMTFPKNTIGQTFRNMRMFVRVTPENIFLDTMSVQAGKDSRSLLLANGEVSLADLMKNFDFNKIDNVGYKLNLAFNDFVPVNTKSETTYLHTAKITGAMTVSAQSLAFTTVKGDLQIRNSEIWVVDPTKAKIVTDVNASKSTKKDKEVKEVNYYKNLDMDLNVSLPENTDNNVRSAEMLLGLQGDINVTKPPGSEDFFITGDVNTKKGGKYAYLNAAFTIDQGNVKFTGEPGLNPELDIVAVKRFEYRTDDGESIPAEAQIKVTGKLLRPVIAIIAVERGTDSPLDGLTEPADILSYLVLGVKTSDLAKLGKEQAGDFAKQVAINQLLNAVANQAGLQKLEYQAGTSGQGSSIAVAKRISESVSVSFEGGFDATSARNITLELVADSVVNNIPVLRKILGPSWKKTLEFEYKKPAQGQSTQQEDIINVIFYFRKEY
ncbi:translocation/assembly module TamB domain-containing protein [bacterium]|nr:translocation/assembly module TamB domain-containing protein [bacterium]